jgi:hypothetical protein
MKLSSLITRALEEAGLADLSERLFAGQLPHEGDLARLREADTLVLAALADALREHCRGDRVRAMSSDAARRARDLVRVSPDVMRADGTTGEQALREVALARLTSAQDRSVGVGIEEVGLELAQVALTFGADVLWTDLDARRTLPLLDGPAARRTELAGLIARSGRSVEWVDAPTAAVEQRS